MRINQYVNEASGSTAYHNTVIPGEDSKLIQPCDEIPSGGNVASDEDAESENGEWVHQSGSRLVTCSLARC